MVHNELSNNAKLKDIVQKTIVFSIILMAFFYFTGVGVEFIDER